VSEERTHVLKCIPPYFEAVANGVKTFEVRFNDRGFRNGDLLDLREWLPNAEQFTGRSVLMRVKYILDVGDSRGIVPGFVVMALRDEGTSPF